MPKNLVSTSQTEFQRGDGHLTATSPSPLLPIAYPTGAENQYVWTSDANGNGSWQAVPVGTTSAQGALQLDGTAADIASTGPQAAGAIGKAADAGHVHFSSGMFLCTPSSYAPGSQTILAAGSTTFAVPSLATTVAAGSNGGEISTVASWSAPSSGILDVASTTGFPTSGTLLIAATGPTVGIVTYTGTSGGNSFTGCAYVSGSATGTVATAGLVALSGAAPAISTGPFTAPASGNVLVSTVLVAECTSSSTAIAFGLAAHGTVTPMIGSSFQYKSSGTTLGTSTPAAFLVTGLTPGTSYNFDLLAAASSGNLVAIFAFSQTSTSPTFGTGGVGCPVVMTVQGV